MAHEQTPTGDALFTRAFGLLVIGHLLQGLGYSSMLLLPLYLQHLGASRTEIGTITAVAAVSGLVTRPAVGWALDTLGRRSTLIVGTITLVASMALIAPVDRVGIVIYLQRVLFGVAVGILFTGYFAFAADIIPVKRRTEGLALFGISGLLPLLVNPLSDRLSIEPPDLRWFLPLVGGIAGLSLIALVALREPRAKTTEPSSMRHALAALRKRPLWPVWLATFAFAGNVAVFFTFATVAAERRGVGDAATLWLSYALGAAVIRLFGARVPDRVGPSNLIAPALGLYVVAMLLATDAATLQDFLIAALLAGVGHGYCFPVLTSQVVTRSPEAFRGSALALFTALWGLAELLLAPLFGAIADRHGDGVMFWVAAFSGIGALVVWLVLEHTFGRSAEGEPAS